MNQISYQTMTKAIKLVQQVIRHRYHIVESQRTKNVTVIFILHQDQILPASRIGRGRNKVRVSLISGTAPKTNLSERQILYYK